MPEALVGQGVAAIDTPALVIDLDAMERNLRRMADFAAARGVRLRPHAKMHKCAELARLQMAHGAVGVCVQKISEALALARGGVTDIYISNQVVDPGKLLRLADAVAQQRGVRWAIAVDSADGVARLASAMAKAGVQTTGAIDVFVEIDAGQNRCGVVPGDAAVTLARQVLACPVLRWAGLQAYHGRAQHLRSAEERTAAIDYAAQAVRASCAALANAGIDVPLVTGAGSGSFLLEAGSGLALYRTDLHSGESVNLTADKPAAYETPRWSADGRQLVFASSRDDPGLTRMDIFVMNADGTAVVNLSRHPHEDFNPHWTADGKRIIFTSLRSGTAQLYAYDLAAKQAVRLTENQSHDMDQVPQPVAVSNLQTVVSVTKGDLSYEN